MELSPGTGLVWPVQTLRENYSAFSAVAAEQEYAATSHDGKPAGTFATRIISQAVNELATMPKGQRAIVSICADGGQGSVMLLESA